MSAVQRGRHACAAAQIAALRATAPAEGQDAQAATTV